MLSSGIPPILQTLAPSPQTATLQPGQTYTAIVRVQNAALVAQIGTVQIPLPEGTALAAGQRLAVEVRAAGNALQVALAPAPAATSPAAGASPPPLETLLRPILQALGKLDLGPRAPSLVPPHAPPSQAALAPLFTVLLSERGLGQDLQQLQQLLSNLPFQAALPAGTAAAVVQWLGLAPGPTGEAWRNLLDRARAERATAARIAQTLGTRAGGGSLAAARDSAAALAQRLLNSEAFTALLQERGELEPFKALTQRLHDRALGGDLQNLRALDQPYQFLELPVREADGFRRAHIHSFSEKGGGPNAPQTPTHRTVLDIETTRLGPLWIALHAAEGHCACRIKAVEHEVAALMRNEADALRESLQGAGYQNASVTVEPWDGNREEAVYQLLAPYQKLDLEG